VKLNDGKIVDHGFNIKWGLRNGQCFGVGYKPIEVSTEGAVAYRNSLEIMVKQYQYKKHTLVKYNGVVVKHNNYRSGKIEEISFGEEGYQKELDITLAIIDNDIRKINKDIDMFNSIIHNWKAQPLPDTIKEVA